MKLVDNWKEAWKWYSVWSAGAVVTLGGIGSYLTPEMLAAAVVFFPDWTWAKVLSSVTAFFGVTGLLGRLISQSPVEQK